MVEGYTDKGGTGWRRTERLIPYFAGTDGAYEIQDSAKVVEESCRQRCSLNFNATKFPVAASACT